jgi:alpha-L-fucosidase
VAGADFERFEQYLHAQVTEVVQRYHPAVMWFDGEWENTWTHERGVRLFDLCRRLAPAMIVNNRVDVHRGGMAGFSDAQDARGDFATPEQEIPATGVPGVDWETCMTMNDNWGFNKADAHWKPARELLRKLCDIVSKGGNFLLNVGPRADGTFPPEAVERLAALAAWMQHNGSAIHGTSASPFEALPFGRCTQRRDGDDTVLNLLVFDWPADGKLVLPGLGNDVKSAQLLRTPDAAVAVHRSGSDVVVDVPKTAPDRDVAVVAVRIVGAPIVYRTPRLTAPAPIFVDRLQVAIDAGPGLEAHYTVDGSEPTTASPLATGGVTLTASATLSVRSFHRGQPASPSISARFEKVRAAPAAEKRGADAGLLCHIVGGDFDKLPDFGAVKPSATVVEPLPALPSGYQQEHEARCFQGFVDVPATDVWMFELASDDGSQLLVDGYMVVDHDGLHGATGMTGVAALAAGPHAIEVRWFNKTGGAALSVAWARGGAKAAAIPAAAFSH